jgi:hypothetical protein
MYPPPPLSISTRDPEPAAYLTMELEVTKPSRTFADAIGRPMALRGMKLVDMLIPADRGKALQLQKQMQEEQKQRDPSYLPPIFSKHEEDRLFHELGFSPEEIAGFSLSRQEVLTFTGQDGLPRPLALRIGFAKQGSIYFAVILLSLTSGSYQQPSPSPHSREVQYAFPQAMQPYGQPTPVSATFDPRQARFVDTGFVPRQSPSQAAQLMPGLSPGMGSSYAASPSRPDYTMGPSSYQTPRSELAANPQTAQPPAFQLPPIRSQQQSQSQQRFMPPAAEGASPTGRAEDRPRVDIGGLIDKPGQQQQAPR